jgi:beta-1,4-N-acetylglucosaminyltransferase
MIDGFAQEARRAERVLLVCSGGGHLTQLVRLRPWWRERDRHWVTFRQPDAESLLEDEKVTWAYHPTTRNIPNLLRNLWLAVRLLPRYRPDVVVSTGAGVAFPFFLLAKLFGARTIYLEVYDRIDSGTLTGKLCYPVADLFLLQWDEQRAVYPRGVVLGELL